MNSAAQTQAEVSRIAKRTSSRVLDMKKPGPVVVVKSAAEKAVAASKAFAVASEAVAKKAAAKKPAAKKAAAKKATKPAAKKAAAKKAPAAKKALKARAKANAKAIVKEATDRSAAIAKSWTDPKVAALRKARMHVKVHGVEYRSVHDAFVELGLPESKHVHFRGALRVAPNGKLAFEGHTFSLVK